jgi:MtN3 and saliva related transmembrane protein
MSDDKGNDEHACVAANHITLIGFFAAALTTLAFVPQVVRTLRTGDTRAISLWMYVLFTAGVFLWLVYGSILALWPVVIANGITFLLAFAVLILKIRNG